MNFATILTAAVGFAAGYYLVSNVMYSGRPY